MEKNTPGFYAGLTPLYHLIYPDWGQSVERQAGELDALIRELWGEKVHSVLDASCGIGTQALGLAQLGYEVTASDLSPEAIERAKMEAQQRNLQIAFSVADMREAFTHHGRKFDAVISCDNSVPHLLTDDEIRKALRQFYLCTRPGGGCLISVRDYEKEDFSRQQIKPYGIRVQDGIRWLIWQVWDPHETTYDLSIYFVEDSGGTECRAHVFRSTYYAVSIPRLMELMKEAGFADVCRADDRFFQPVLIGTRKDR